VGLVAASAVGLAALAAVEVAASGVSEAVAAEAVAPAEAGDNRYRRLDMERVQRRVFVQAVILVAMAAVSGCSYNRFTGSEEAIKAQWGQVQNQLQRRNDLIPNLVETVKGFAAQEKEILTSIAASREKLAGARTPDETIKAANEQSAALARLLVVVENYPNLKSDATFHRLMDELGGTENRIAVERMRYNERVQEYNTLRRRFPSNVTAKVFGFKEYPYYEAPAAAQQLPKVNFGR
jgi:LemA protein